MRRAVHALFCAAERVLEPRHETWSVASQNCTELTSCDQREGRNLCTFLDLCVSSVTQKISQKRLRIVTPLRRRTLLAVQAMGDPAFNWRGCPLPPQTLSDPWRCFPHGPRRCHAQDASPVPASEGLSTLCRCYPHRSHIGICPDSHRLQAHVGTAAYVQQARFTSRVWQRIEVRRRSPLPHPAAVSLLPSLLNCRSRRYVVAVLPANMFTPVFALRNLDALSKPPSFNLGNASSHSFNSSFLHGLFCIFCISSSHLPMICPFFSLRLTTI